MINYEACTGLVESAAEYFTQMRWQRCTMHFYRNVFSHAPGVTMLKAIHAQDSRDAALDTAQTSLHRAAKAAATACI